MTNGSDWDEDDDLPVITGIRMYQGRLSEAEMARLEPTDAIETSTLGAVELTIALEWKGGRGIHRLEFQVGMDSRYGGELNVDKTHSTVFRIVSQQASGVSAGTPRTYPIYFWWDGVPAGQRYLTVVRRR